MNALILDTQHQTLSSVVRRSHKIMTSSCRIMQLECKPNHLQLHITLVNIVDAPLYYDVPDYLNVFVAAVTSPLTESDEHIRTMFCC